MSHRDKHRHKSRHHTQPKKPNKPAFAPIRPAAIEPLKEQKPGAPEGNQEAVAS